MQTLQLNQFFREINFTKFLTYYYTSFLTNNIDLDPTSGSPSISSSSVSLNELPIKNIIEKSNSTESSDCNEEKSIQVPMPLVEENKEPGVSSLQNFTPFFMQKKNSAPSTMYKVDQSYLCIHSNLDIANKSVIPFLFTILNNSLYQM